MAYNERLENPRYECIDGVERMLAQPATPHITIAKNLTLLIGGYLRGKQCKLFAEADVFFDEKNHYIPDLIVVCDRKKIQYRGIFGAPDLVVEILSPSTAQTDRKEKLAAYGKFGVREYWIVNPKDRSVEVYRPAEGRMELDSVYHDFSEDDWALLTEKEQAQQKMTLKVSLYDDLEINVKEIFEDM